jgi:hypothetical protein
MRNEHLSRSCVGLARWISLDLAGSWAVNVRCLLWLAGSRVRKAGTSLDLTLYLGNVYYVGYMGRL